MKIKNNIISKRYLNDNISLVNLNINQKKYLSKFMSDKKIKYNLIVKCPLCKSENYTTIAEKDRYAIPLKTVICENCGLIRSYKQLNERSSRRFYQKYYRGIYESNPQEEINRRYHLAKKKKIPKYATKDKIILELGCGGGWNLVPFHKKGYRYFGFDFDKEFINYGKKKGLNLFLGGIEEIIKKKVKCDYLLLDHVLEHVNNPIKFLKSLKPLLNEGAIIEIHVPSLNLIFWGYANYDLLGLLQSAHNYLFDEFTLKAIAISSGLKIIKNTPAHLILKNSQDLKQTKINLHKLNRGKKIIRYLNFIEKNLQLRIKTRTNRISFEKIYYLLNGLIHHKTFLVNYFARGD